MIVIKIELWPRGQEMRARELGRMHLINLGDTTKDNPNRGDYRVEVMRRGTKLSVIRKGEVANYPRKSYNIWRLIARAVKSAFPEEK